MLMVKLTQILNTEKIGDTFIELKRQVVEQSGD